MPDFGPSVGIQFVEAASGHVASGISDAAVAQDAGQAFQLNLQIAIPKLQGFLDSGVHVAQLGGGTISWKPDLQAAPVLAGGTATYFRDVDGTGKHKSIEFAFSFHDAQGRVVDFKGVKDLHDDNGLDTVTDLSTITVSLQANGQSAGAGVLRSNVADFFRQVQSCKVTGAQSDGEEDAARKAFLGFVNGQLREVYPNLPLIFPDATRLSPEQRRTLELCARLLLPEKLPQQGPQLNDLMASLDRFLANASSSQLTTITGWLQAIGIFLPPGITDVTLLRKLVTAQLNNTDRSPIRDVLQLIHLLVVFPYYADPKADALVNYTRPVHQPRNTPDLPVVAEPPQRVFDFVIAGSGPAGTLLAQRLAAKGKSVLVLESGPYVPERTIDSDEVRATARLYKSSGLQQANSGSLFAGLQGPTFTVLQGACIGGGGIVNNAVCFRLPPGRLSYWQSLGFPVSADDLSAAYTRVAQDLGIKAVSDAAVTAPRLNPAWTFLTNKLGPPKKPTVEDPTEPGLYECLVNLDDCLSTGLCNVGCGSERKRNGAQVYLRQAAAAGCVIVANAEVQAVNLDAGSPAGARRVGSLEVRLPGGKQVTVRGTDFILSCGAIGSSAVLLNSGDLDEHIQVNRLPVGQRFSANLGSPIFAFCPNTVNQRPGVQIAHYYFAPPDDGFVIETWFNPPGANAIAMPGFQQAHFDRMMAYSKTVAASPLVGSDAVGQITLDAQGNPAIDFPITSNDVARLRRGLVLLAGAFLSGNVDSALVALGNGRKIQTAADLAQLDKDLADIQNDPSKAYLLRLGTGHPQGGNAMSSDPKIGVIDEQFRLRGFENLRICDGSIFPDSAGVNPQWTIMALAHECARLLVGA
ncbi:MAG TPA: GMC family oxidoreductase [Candidatus Acidoferrales bacterium]|nr:GMC family oxidoreductase [Candidatus Acidoferrales bacterium]